MKEFPMLVGVEEARVIEVGGKAAILEQIVAKSSKLARWMVVPKFQIWGDAGNFVLPTGIYAFRASNLLDVLGGCGLHNTYHNVSSANAERFATFVQSPSDMKTRLERYAKSVGRQYTRSAVLCQEQRHPTYWAVVMEHPNKDSVFFVNISDYPSAETKKGNQSDIDSASRQTFGLTCSTTSVLPKNYLRFERLLDKILSTYQRLKELEIISLEYASIMEAGLTQDEIEIYQFTPIRKKGIQFSGQNLDQKKAVIGTLEECTIPIYHIPSLDRVITYLTSGRSAALTENLTFKLYVDDKLDKGLVAGRNTLFRNRDTTSPWAQWLTWDFIKHLDTDFPNGYMVCCVNDRKQEFDIPMRNAKVVLRDTTSPAYGLNHSCSRLLYKSPVLILEDNCVAPPDGTTVKFSAMDGTFTLKQI